MYSPEKDYISDDNYPNWQGFYKFGKRDILHHLDLMEEKHEDLLPSEVHEIRWIEKNQPSPFFRKSKEKRNTFLKEMCTTRTPPQSLNTPVR